MCHNTKFLPNCEGRGKVALRILFYFISQIYFPKAVRTFITALWLVIIWSKRFYYLTIRRSLRHILVFFCTCRATSSQVKNSSSESFFVRIWVKMLSYCSEATRLHFPLTRFDPTLWFSFPETRNKLSDFIISSSPLHLLPTSSLLVLLYDRKAPFSHHIVTMCRIIQIYIQIVVELLE